MNPTTQHRIQQEKYGPNGQSVEALIDQARKMSLEDGKNLLASIDKFQHHPLSFAWDHTLKNAEIISLKSKDGKPYSIKPDVRKAT